MKVNPNTKLSEIQMEFHRQYPGLKIEFFNKSHEEKNASPNNQRLDGSLSLSDVLKSVEGSEIDFSPEKSVSEIEQNIEAQLGLHAQVLRRSKDVWLQTTKTDDWSLTSQNRKGIHSTQQ